MENSDGCSISLTRYKISPSRFLKSYNLGTYLLKDNFKCVNLPKSQNNNSSDIKTAFRTDRLHLPNNYNKIIHRLFPFYQRMLQHSIF